ncbi:MAG: DUF2141 domain-containing protein [Flavobacteriales bacterium]
MKTFFLVLGLSLSFLIVKGQEQVTLELKIENIREEGTLMIAVFDSQKNWNKKCKPVVSIAKKVKVGSKKVEFKIPIGKYGIATFIDTNQNRFYDYGKEWYAFSNQYVPKENPTFNHFAIEVNQNEKIIMKMIK